MNLPRALLLHQAAEEERPAKRSKVDESPLPNPQV